MAFQITPLDADQLEQARRLLADACPSYRAARVAEEKLFELGSALPESWAAWVGAQLAGVATRAGGYLRLLAVAPAWREVGVGSALLSRCEERAAKEGQTRLVALAEPGNYLTPGVAADDAATLGWLRRRGFTVDGEAVNLIVDLVGNSRVTAARFAETTAHAAAAGYRILRASADSAAALCAAIVREHPAAWAVEVERALEAHPGGVYVARTAGSEIAAFAAHDGNNRGLGWFGPAATFAGHRRRGLGAALLLGCLLEVAATGQPRCTVAWIGPYDFYERVVGVAGERRYIRMHKELR